MAKRKAKKSGPGKAQVQDYRHDDAKRKNNPPAKIAAEGTVPVVPKARYAYSPRLDPVLRFDADAEVEKLLEKAARERLTDDDVQKLAAACRQHEPWLEWAEKREQHQRGFFEVDPVALHIHERVSAQAILKAAARQDVQRSLFNDPEQAYHEAVQFYRHDIDWTNRLILGDSLQVMSSLARREDLAGKVQMIYMDPPYGIKFRSNFQPEVGRPEVNEKQADLTREPEMVKAYRDTWHLGLHSYLSYLRDRLAVAKELLADPGSIFIQISDQNLHRVRQLMDEIFGVTNFIAQIQIQKTGTQTGEFLVQNSDFVIWYAKDRKRARDKYNQLYQERPIEGLRTDSEGGNGNHWSPDPMTSDGYRETTTVDFLFQGRQFHPGNNRHWGVDLAGLRRAGNAERIVVQKDQIRFKKYHSDYPVSPLGPTWSDVGGARDKRYVVQTTSKIAERCMLMTTDPGDLVLDPTCGSGTTAYVSEQWGRRWITIDTSRVAVSIARQRLLTAQFDRYRVKGENENGNGDGSHRPGVDPHPGFRYRTVPHVTLKSIARNSNLDAIFAKWEPVLDEKLAACNRALREVTDDLRHQLSAKLAAKRKQDGARSITDADRRRWELPKSRTWQHWEVPFDTDPACSKPLQKAVTDYRKAWREKMDEVTACIAANAEPEDLVDQPEIVRGVVRVSGPFTVEAVQPPEMSLGDVTYAATGDGLFGGEPEQLETTFIARPVEARPNLDVQNVEAYLDQMLRYLRIDGVRFPNNKQMQFTRLDRLETGSPGLHAEGRWMPAGQADADPDGRAAVVVAIGPQYGPVTAKMVEEVVRSSNRMGYDDLVIAGFSFDGPAQAVIQEAQHPRLRIHAAHVRPDVNPGMNGLLKEQPGSQLFTVFGQPRTTLRGPDKHGEYTVVMEGVDIYNPVDNTISPTRADKVAAWFLDSDYDDRTFCITQAFFPDRSAWDKLAAALKGVIDEDRFEALSGTESLPFPPGKHQCVAVKVIDPAAMR